MLLVAGTYNYLYRQSDLYREKTMSTVLHLLAIVGIGYLIGSIPTANMVMRRFKGQDLRHVGTGNITSTAVIIHAGKLAGTISIVGELLKIFLCLLAAYMLVDALWAYLVILIAAAVGQMWSVWLGWSGGQGQTILVTGFLALCPVPFALAAACFLGSYLITRRIVLSNQIFHLVAPFVLLLAILFNPHPLGLGHESWGYAVAGLPFALLFFLKQRPESDDLAQSQSQRA